MAKTTQTGLQNSFTTAVAARASVLLGSTIILPEIMAVNTDLRPSGVGNTVRVNRAPKGTMRDAADLSGKTYDVPTQSYDEISLDYFREINFQNPDLDEAIAPESSTYGLYAESGATQISYDIEKNILYDILDDPNYSSYTEVGTVGTAMNLKALATIRKNFVNAGVPVENQVVILDPAKYADLLQVSTLQSEDFVTKGAVEAGRTPRIIMGMRVYESTALDTNDRLSSVTGTDTGEISVAFDSRSILMTMARLRNSYSGNGIEVAQENARGYSVRVRRWGDADLNTDRMSMDALYGIKVVLNPSVTSSTDVALVQPILGGVA